VPERSAEAVQFPDDQGVAGPQLVEDLLEGGPVGPGVAGGLGEDSVAAGALQGVDLKRRLLVGGRDAGVAEQVPHAGERPTTP
jgi:ABC-type sugar transport system substrate-binding protein